MLGFVEHRDVRLDPALMHQPGEVLGRAIGGIGRQPFGIEAEAILGPVDHGACRADLRLPDRAARLDIDNDGMVEVDQVVGGVGEKGMALERPCPLRGGI